MKNKSRVRRSVFVLILGCVLLPAVGLRAQQTAAAPAPANALDQLTAPIALYPDALVVQILTASKNADKLMPFAAWLKQNASLKGSELQTAAQKAGFDEALVALAPFPQVVQMMVEKPDWTKALGQAVTTDKKAVSDSIQRLRAQAMAAGNLKTTEQQKVETQTTSAGQQVIIIQPANPQVIYVPVYNTQTVYVESSSSANAAGAAVVGFTVGVLVANNNHYYHNHYEDYWEDREDYYEDRAEDARENQDERQSNAQANQDERQSGRQQNQDQRQSGSASAQSQGTANQGSRQSAAPTAQTQPAASSAQRKSAGTTSTWGGGASTSRSSGMSSSGASSYQSGAATRSQSSRGSASMSSRGGGRSGGGRR